MAADDIDNQIETGDLDVDIAGTGVQSAMLAKLLDDNDPLHKRADNPGSARLWYTSINAERWLRWTTCTAAGRSSTRPTAPVTSSPTVESSPVARSTRRR